MGAEDLVRAVPVGSLMGSVSTTLRALITADPSDGEAALNSFADSAMEAADRVAEAFNQASTDSVEASESSTSRIGAVYDGLSEDAAAAFEKIAAAADASGSDVVAATKGSVSDLAGTYDGMAADATAAFDKIAEAADTAGRDHRGGGGRGLPYCCGLRRHGGRCFCLLLENRRSSRCHRHRHRWCGGSLCGKSFGVLRRHGRQCHRCLRQGQRVG